MIKSSILSCVLFLTLFISPSYAHEVRPSYLELIQQSEDTYAVLWKVPAKGNSLRLSLTVRFADNVKNVTEAIEYFSNGSYIKRWKIRHDQALINTTINIEGLQSTFTEVLVRIEQLDGSVQVSRLMPDNPSVLVEASPTAAQVAYTYTRLGIKHILMGVDHLLFLVCLLLIARTPKRILITITGFTIAHSTTLVISALGIVNLNVAAVEAIIALSIVFLATEIAKGKQNTLSWNYPVSVSASFGLLHGFGFAAVLNEIGLPQTELATGLLFFNIGVEIGQLFFVLVILLLVKTLMWVNLAFRCTILQKPIAYCVGTLSSYWLLERSASFIIW
jgi:hydrogenase/urease accessory protein HupE